MLRFLIFQVVQMVLGVLSGRIPLYLLLHHPAEFGSSHLDGGCGEWGGRAMGRVDPRRERPLPSTPSKCGLLAPEHTPGSSRPTPCFYRRATS